MGFFDSMKKGFETEQSNINNRHYFDSNYRNVAQRRNDRFNELNAKDDGFLLRKYKTLSDEDREEKEEKTMIGQILSSRGYRRNSDGSFNR